MVISMVVFTGVRMIPGDPARVMAGTDADTAGLEEIREKYGLRDPIPVQYLRWGRPRPARRPRRVDPDAAVGGVDGRDQAADHGRARVPGAPGRVVARDPGRRAGRGPAEHPVGRRRQRGLALRRVDSELLAGDHADPARLGATRVAAR